MRACKTMWRYNGRLSKNIKSHVDETTEKNGGGNIMKREDLEKLGLNNDQIEGVMKLKSSFANEIFHDELYHIYEQKDEANAINALEKAIEIDPTYADAYGEIGRIYYNAAVNESNKANEIQNNAEYRKAKEEIVKPAFQKAIPYYEKAHEYKPDETGFLYNLKSIYYNIDDGANLERVEKLLGE